MPRSVIFWKWERTLRGLHWITSWEQKNHKSKRREGPEIIGPGQLVTCIRTIVRGTFNLLINRRVAFHYMEEKIMKKLRIHLICPSLEYVAKVWSPQIKKAVQSSLNIHCLNLYGLDFTRIPVRRNIFTFENTQLLLIGKYSQIMCHIHMVYHTQFATQSFI